MDVSIIYKGSNQLFAETLCSVCKKHQLRYVNSSEISQPSCACEDKVIIFNDFKDNYISGTCCEILVLTPKQKYTSVTGHFPLDVIYSDCPEELLENKLNLYLNNLDKCLKTTENFKTAMIVAAKEKIIIDRFKKISCISRKVNSLDTDQIARACVEDIPDIFHATYASLYTYNEENDCLHLLRHNHSHKISSLVSVSRNADRPMAIALRSKKLMVIEDLETHHIDCSHNCKTEYKTKSCVIAPLLSGDKVLGILNLADKYDLSNFEKQTDLPALELLCELIGAALNNIQLYLEVNKKAQTDGMTSLVNHTTFYNILKRELNRFERYGSRLSLLMVDLDGLKTINDKHGHLAGDKVIKHIAQSIKKCIRQTDIAARYGGDEFAIILPETSINDAEIIADRLLNEVESNPVMFKDQAIHATISIGVGESENGQSLEEFVDDIDSALFCAKENGKNRRIIA